MIKAKKYKRFYNFVLILVVLLVIGIFSVETLLIGSLTNFNGNSIAENDLTIIETEKTQAPVEKHFVTYTSAFKYAKNYLETVSRYKTFCNGTFLASIIGAYELGERIGWDKEVVNKAAKTDTFIEFRALKYGNGFGENISIQVDDLTGNINYNLGSYNGTEFTYGSDYKTRSIEDFMLSWGILPMEIFIPLDKLTPINGYSNTNGWQIECDASIYEREMAVQKIKLFMKNFFGIDEISKANIIMENLEMVVSIDNYGRISKVRSIISLDLNLKDFGFIFAILGKVKPQICIEERFYDYNSNFNIRSVA